MAELEQRPAADCSSAAQATCCEPADKAECCSDGSPSCGCSAGDSDAEEVHDSAGSAG